MNVNRTSDQLVQSRTYCVIINIKQSSGGPELIHFVTLRIWLIGINLIIVNCPRGSSHIKEIQHRVASRNVVNESTKGSHIVFTTTTFQRRIAIVFGG